MKPILIVLLLVFAPLVLKPQDTTNVVQAQVNLPLTGQVLSDNPSATELVALLTSNEVASREAIRRIVEKRENAVAGLVEILTSAKERWLKNGDPMSATPNKLIAVDALARLRSFSGFTALAQSGMNEPDPQVKGTILSALARDYYALVAKGDVAPTKEVVQVFVANLGDETFVGSAQRTIGQISQEGIMAWLGVDFGDPMFEQDRLAAGGGKDIGAVRYASTWWQNNGSNLEWNQETGHFQVKSE